MKMLVSDYDNTFHIKDEDMELNVKKANEFMKDNLFVIATGRSYESYMEAKEKFNINSHYIIINHGATILKGNDVIYNKAIDNDVKENLIDDLEINNIDYYHCYKGLDEVEITEDDINKILIVYKDHDTAVKIRQLIKDKYANELKNFHFTTYNSVEVVSADVDKAYAVDYIYNIEKPDKLYVIGDNHNDYLMIKNYNGSCTHVAIDIVKEIAVKEYLNVSDFIDEIEG